MATFEPKSALPDNVTDRGKVERIKLSGPGNSTEETEWVDVATQAELDAHTGDSSAAHAASAISFSATGSIAGTDVQTAVAEVATDAAAALSSHEGGADPHPGYLLGSAAPELIRDTVATALVPGANVTITPNDGADTITIAASGGGGVDTGAAPNALTGSPTLLAWYKADAITGLSDGDAVATWTDSGPNSYTLSQGTAGNRPTYRASTGFNDMPGVEFDGTDDFIRNSSTGASSQTNLTGVVVLATMSTANQQIFDLRGTGFFNLNTNGGVFAAQVGATPLTLQVTSKAIFNPFVAVVRSNGTKAQLFVNGVLHHYAETGSAAVTPSSIQLGYNTVNLYFKGFIFEVAFYSAYLSQAQIRQVSRHLANKYGLPLGYITA